MPIFEYKKYIYSYAYDKKKNYIFSCLYLNKKNKECLFVQNKKNFVYVYVNGIFI